MTQCNIKKSQCLDLDYPEYEMVISTKHANRIAEEKGKPYFIFNNFVYMTMHQNHFDADYSKTNFWRIDLLNG